MKLNKFKKLIMISASVLAIAPVATVSAMNANTNTVQARIRRAKGWRVLTKMTDPNVYSFIKIASVVPAGSVFCMHNYEVLGNNKYKTITYGDITCWMIIKLDKHNSKWFKSKKQAYAYAHKYFPETDDAIDDSQLTKAQLKRRRAYQNRLDKENGVTPAEKRQRKEDEEALEHGMDPDWYDKHDAFQRKLHDETKDIDGIENPLE